MRITNKLFSIIIKDFPIHKKNKEKDMYLKNVVIPKINRSNALFIHVPKAAGSSIQKAVFGLNSWTHHKYKDFEKELPEQTLKKVFKFSFTRNPYDRLFSAYQYLKNGGNNITDKYWAKKYLNSYPTFEKFVKEFITTKNVYKYVHFIPQHEFLIDRNGKIQMDFLGKFETIDDDFNTICKRLVIQNSLESLNITKRKKEIYSLQAYNCEMKNIVYEVYKKDFILLDYSK